jgi:hypothetical protein
VVASVQQRQDTELVDLRRPRGVGEVFPERHFRQAEEHQRLAQQHVDDAERGQDRDHTTQPQQHLDDLLAGPCAAPKIDRLMAAFVGHHRSFGYSADWLFHAFSHNWRSYAWWQ